MVRSINPASAITPPDDSRWDFLERSESQLWRGAFWLLALLAVWAATTSWEHLHNLPLDLRGVPAGVLLLVGLFLAYTWGRRKEIAELRRYVHRRGLQGESDPSAARVEQLYRIVSESQRGYRDLIDSFDDIVCSISMDGRLLSANRRLEDLCSARIETLVGRSVAELFEEPSAGDIEREMSGFLERRYWKGTLKVRVRKTGAIRYYDAVLQGIVKDGRVTAISALCRDTTLLRESEARFTELFQTLQEGIYIRSGADDRLLDVNPAFVHMLGYDDKSELISTPWRDLLLDSEGEGCREGEIHIRRKQGGTITCLTTCTPMFSPTGEVDRYQGTLTDITLRKEMERRLRSEQEFARRLVASFPEIIAASDREGFLTFVSPRIGEVLGYSPAELLGQPWDKLAHEGDQPRVQAALHGLIEGRESMVAIEYRMFHKDGSVRVVLTSACALADDNGRITGLVATTHDLTDRRRLEQQVIQTEKLAAMGRMVAGVAHELNNPLTVVLGASDLSSSRSQDPMVRRHFELIHQQARRTAEIVQSLLSFARPASPGHTPLDLEDVIRRSLRLSDYPLRMNNIRADVQLPQGLGVMGDPSQLIQVFINLITNGQQAIREVKERGTIRIRGGRTSDGSENGKVWVSFQDDGPGIKDEFLPNIFDPFFTTKRPGQGTGLGLSICLAIVRDHGGVIEARDTRGGGAEFVVTLPATAGKPRLMVTAGPVPEAPNPRGKSILVVDDEQAILDLVGMALRNREMFVECCPSGETALAVMAKRQFDLILCDMRMPGMTGQDFYEQVLTRFGKVAPFFLITAEPSHPETLEFARSRDVKLLAKPFSIAGLLVTLAAA
jgi:PAS domain S-box-containing protein